MNGFIISGAVWSILNGLAMSGFWTVAIYKKKIPELDPENSLYAPKQIMLHVTSEFMTSFTLLIGGISLLLATNWPIMIYMFGTGAVIYSMLNAMGYYVEEKTHDTAMVRMFAVNILVTIVLFALVLWGALQ